MSVALTFALADNLLGRLSQAQIDYEAVRAALRDKGANLSEDADAGKALADVVAQLAAAGVIAIPGGPLLEVELAGLAVLIGLILTYGTQDKPGAVSPTFAGGDKPRGSNPNMG